MSSMDSGAPLLNDYKLAFFAKRFPQTLLGGLKLRLGYKAPFYVYVNQVLFFLFPFVFGGIFTGLSESLIVNSLTCCYVFASLVTCSVITVNIIIVWIKEKQYTNVSKIQQNVLAEEDEVEFESCCGLETLEFIFTAKKSVLQICMHGVLSGILCGLLFLYLLPSNLNKLYSNTAATVLLYIFGWLTVCVAQYSLTASPPPEPASFQPQLWFDISPFMRPFYAVMFGVVGVIAQSHPELLLADQILHFLFPVSLVLWIFGTLPPLDALFPWLLEQYLVFAIGGSPMATDIRLFIMALISSIPVILVVFIPSRVAVIIISCICGYILSLDLFSVVSLAKPKVDSSAVTMTTCKIKQWSLKEVIVVAAMFVLGVSCSAVGAVMSDKATSSMLEIFGVIFCVILVILKLLGDLQGVYIFGLLRNPLFPRSTQSSSSFQKRKRQLEHIAKVYHVLLGYVCPLLMTAFLGLFLNNQSYELTGFTAILCAFGIVRAMRQIWQNTFLCLLDLCVVCLIDKSWWITSELAIQLLFTSLCRDRTLQFLKKMVFLLTVAVTSVSMKKQRHKATPAILILSVFFLPVLFAVVLSTVVLSSPLLPMFCLPIFLIGFPRPLRSWPLTGNTKISTGEDAVYYKQLAPEVITSLTQSLASGALGIRQAGEHFILRYQDRLVWVHVVESGYRFIAVVIKGLEMQETSCHTLEAARVDETFETAFVRDDMQSIFYFNPYFFNTLSPCDVATLQSYSDARNVLTGIIDQHDNLRKVSENFIKTFTWVVLHYCKKNNKNLGNITEKSVKKSDKGTEELPNAGRKVIVVNSHDDGDVHKGKDEMKSTETALLQRSGSLPSINGSIWSQDSYELETLDLCTGKHTSKQPAVKKNKLDSLDCILDEVDESTDIKPKTSEYLPLGGFPAVDTGARKNTGSGFTEISSDTLITVLPYHEPQNDNNKNTITTQPLMSKASYQVDLPLQWKTSLPVNDKQLKPVFDKFPSSWFQHIINDLHLTEDDSVGSDSELMARYQRFILIVYTVVEMLGYPGSSSMAAGPIHPFKVCNGDIPWSIHLDWLQKDKTLMSLVLKAYRYAFKLMYDEAVLGEITSFEECNEYLSEYESDWYMGKDTEDGWTAAVLNRKPNLFSLGRNTEDGTYTSRVLTRQAIQTPIGHLNGEAVRGQWASLALELLYFTNDDEERYSIQAHPVLLRNLTIQAADPPLGYPVYSSGLLSVPIHVSPL